MKNVSVRWKMIILALITLIGTLAIGVLAVNRMLVMEKGSESVLRTSIEEDYDENIKNQVDNAISMLDAVYAGYENGDYSYEEAETRGADLLRELRYGDGGYFWADTYDGDNVVLLGSETEGTNRMETKDADGYQMVKEIIRVGQEPDGGYTDYVFPKEGETESSPKRSYSRAFEPFGWVVGTGNYIDYIDETVVKETQAMKENVKSALLAIIGMGSFLVVIVMAVCLYMAFSLSKSFQVALTYIGYITKGDFSQPLPVQLEKRRDDFGILGERLENMKCQIRDLIREVKNESYVIGEVVDTVKTNVITLNGNIEDVSATTEELAASMEETEVVPNLMIGFGIDEVQADYVAEIKLRHLNREYILKRTGEIEQLEKDIADLNDILAKPARIRRIIINELNDVAKKYAQPRRSEILYDLPEEESGAEEEAIPDYPVTVFFTREGYLKKIPPQSLRTAGAHKLKEGDEIIHQVETRNNVEALFFTDKQQVYKVRLAELEDGKVAQMGIFIPGRLGMDEGENILSMVITSDYSGHMLFFFASGKCAKIPLSSYATKQNRRKLLKAYCDKEPLATMFFLPEETELAIRTSAGRMLLVGTAQIAAKTTRDSQGVAVVTLKKNQTIASVVPADTLELANPHRYRVRSLPATGALVRAEDEGEQMTML